MTNYQKIFALVILLSGFSGHAFAQNINGNWVWISEPNQQNERVAFYVDIKRVRGGKLSGNLWLNTFVEGVEDTDPSFIPFVGRMRGKRASIEFDPMDLRPIWEENMRYKRPKLRSVATLRFVKGQLLWANIKGAGNSLGIPDNLTLKRPK